MLTTPASDVPPPYATIGEYMEGLVKFFGGGFSAVANKSSEKPTGTVLRLVAAVIEKVGAEKSTTDIGNKTGAPLVIRLLIGAMLSNERFMLHDINRRNAAGIVPAAATQVARSAADKNRHVADRYPNCPRRNWL